MKNHETYAKKTRNEQTTEKEKKNEIEKQQRPNTADGGKTFADIR